MNTNFSFTMPVVRYIQRQSEDVVTYEGIRGFAQRELLTRVAGISLSAFAALDIAWHLSVSLSITLQALGKGCVTRKRPVFTGARQHFEIACHLRFTLLWGSLLGFIKPKALGSLFGSDAANFTSGLLFSKKPELFGCHGSEGMSRVGLSHMFCSIVEQLPLRVQSSVKSSLELTQYARGLDKLENHQDDKVREFTSEPILKKIDQFFQVLEYPQEFENEKKRFLIKEVASRVCMVALTIFSVISVVTELFSISFKLSLFALESVFKIIFNLNKKHGFKTIAKIAMLNFIQLGRSLAGVVVCPTIGLLAPFRVQSLLFSPLYKCEKAQVIEKIILDVANLPGGECLLLPISTFTKNSVNDPGGHAVYILITKQEDTYRVSICNRGAMSSLHKKIDKKTEVDVSYEGVPFSVLQEYLDHLFHLDSFETIQKMEDLYKKYSFQLPDEIKNPFLMSLYASIFFLAVESGARIKRWYSEHAMVPQKIGNCYLTSLFGALSLFNAAPKAQKKYRKFVYEFKKKAFERHGHLLDFYPRLSPSLKEAPSAIAKQLLDKQGLLYGDIPTM